MEIKTLLKSAFDAGEKFRQGVDRAIKQMEARQSPSTDVINFTQWCEQHKNAITVWEQNGKYESALDELLSVRKEYSVLQTSMLSTLDSLCETGMNYLNLKDRDTKITSLLDRVRTNYLHQIDEEGQPKASMQALCDLWREVGEALSIESQKNIVSISQWFSSDIIPPIDAKSGMESDYLLCFGDISSVPFVAFYNDKTKLWTVSNHLASSNPITVTYWTTLPKNPEQSLTYEK